MKKINVKKIAELMNAKCGTNIDTSNWPDEFSITGDEYGQIVLE